MLIDLVILLVFPAVVAYAAVSDLLTMTISNRISLILVVTFFVVAIGMGMPWAQVGQHLAAGFLILAVTFIFFARGWIGGGDAKLAAAISLWFGFPHLMDFLLLSAVFGGWLTFGLLDMRYRPLPALVANEPWAQKLHRVDTGIPYGIALSAAALAVYPFTIFMNAGLR